MKKIFKFNVMTLLFILSFISIFTFIGCSSDEEEVEDTFIELTLSNYEYYLSLDSELLDYGSVAGGSYRYSSYKMTVYGAVNGIYEDCVIYYKFGENSTTEHSQKLNISGYATFNYSVVNGKNLIICRVEGKIYI